MKPSAIFIQRLTGFVAFVLWATVAAAAPLDDALRAYESGDFAAAREGFLGLATGGDAEAQFRLGHMSEHGEGVTANLSVAANWYREAATRGHAEAQFRLGRFYEDGQGLPFDPASAAEWYRKAALQGVAGAQTRLGLLLIDRGEEAEGEAWIEQAAEAGDPGAQAIIAAAAPPPPPEPAPAAAATVATVDMAPAALPPPPDDLSPAERALYGQILEELDRLTPEGTELRMGPIEVDERDNGFHVTLTDVRVISTVERVAVDLGTLEFDMTPRDAATYAVTMAWPELITVHDETGNEVAHATFGERSFEGTWSPAFGGYLEQRLVLGDIVLTIEDASFEVRAERVAYEAALGPSGPGRVSGPSAYSLSGLTVRDGQGHELVRIGSVSGTSAVRDLDRGLLNRMNQGMTSMSGPDSAAGGPNLSFMPETPGDIIGDASMDFAVRDIAVSDPTGGGELFLGSLAYATAVENLDTPLARIDMSYRHDGLVVTGEAASPLVPDAFNLDFAVERLPAARLYGLLLAAGVAAMATPDATPDQLLGDLPGLFAEAATELRIGAIDIFVAGAEAHASGTLTGDPAASGGVVGTFTMFAARLDEAIARLGALQDEPSQQAAFFLSLFQGFGAPETDTTGQPVLAYRLELDPTGAHRLNGQDLAALFGGMTGEAQGTP